MWHVEGTSLKGIEQELPGVCAHCLEHRRTEEALSETSSLTPIESDRQKYKVRHNILIIAKP